VLSWLRLSSVQLSLPPQFLGLGTAEVWLRSSTRAKSFDSLRCQWVASYLLVIDSLLCYLRPC
jgi:hypothetical protein